MRGCANLPETRCIGRQRGNALVSASLNVVEDYRAWLEKKRCGGGKTMAQLLFLLVEAHKQNKTPQS
jgi:hypothetical protein